MITWCWMPYIHSMCSEDHMMLDAIYTQHVQWSWFSDVTGCVKLRCIQWCQRINFTAPGCTCKCISHRTHTLHCHLSLIKTTRPLLFLFTWSLQGMGAAKKYCNFTNFRCVKISVASDHGAFGSVKFRCPRMLLWSLNVFLSFRCLFHFGKTLDHRK